MPDQGLADLIVAGYGVEARHARERGDALLRQTHDRAACDLQVEAPDEQRAPAQLERGRHSKPQQARDLHVGRLVAQDAGELRVGAASELDDVVGHRLLIGERVVQVQQAVAGPGEQHLQPCALLLPDDPATNRP